MQDNGVKPPESATPQAAPAAVTPPVPGASGWMAMLKFTPKTWRRIATAAILIAVGAGAFFAGRRQMANAKSNIEFGDPTGDPSRTVAILYGDKAVTRGELGEYLILRFGADRLDFMLNRKIVEIECAKHGVTATTAEVEARFQEDLRQFGTPLTEQDFVNQILRRFGKTLYEWKEDVIRPKIMMEKLARSQVKIGDADIDEGFEAKYGAKVEVRMIVIDKGNDRVAKQVWEECRKGRAYFLEQARKQFIPNLAQAEGKVPPISKHFGEKYLEETAFRLKENEVGPLMEMKDGTFVILLCEKHVPANSVVRIADVRQQLYLEMERVRIAQKVPELFTEMHKRAMPKKLLDNGGQPSASLVSNPEPQGPTIVQPPQDPVKVPPPPTPQTITPPSGVGPLPEAPMPMPMAIPRPAVVEPMPMTPPMPPAVSPKKG